MTQKEDKSDELALPVPKSKVSPARSRLREIPKGGISLTERIAQGGKPPRHVRENPEQYYYDAKTGRYPRRPEPVPDFEKGKQRAIPCFAAGTLVVTTTGLVPIESLTLGTIVPTFDEFSQTTCHKPITVLLRNKCTRLLYITVGNETIYSTMRHRFWVENKKQWIQAQYLEPGMFLRTIADQVRQIQTIMVQEVPEQESYNLSIADCHTYFVGKEGFLVHNADEGSPEARGIGKIYIGRNAAGNIIYVGQTKQDLLTRQANHRRDARKNPRKYSFKKNMTIEVFEQLRGLTDDEMHYHERRIFDKLKEEGHKLKYLQEPMGYPKINVLLEKYCS